MHNIEQSYGRINTLTEMAQDSTCFNLIKIRSLIVLGSQYNVTGAVLLTIRLTWIYRYLVIICLLNE
jgi:hypothetical protein